MANLHHKIICLLKYKSDSWMRLIYDVRAYVVSIDVTLLLNPFTIDFFYLRQGNFVFAFQMSQRSN